MILREYVRMVLKSPVITEGLEAHILNFYEDLAMPLGELYDVIDAIRDGTLEEVTEKMDGQNITFTVMDETLQFFHKGATWKRVQRGGMSREFIREKYADRPSVMDAFLSSFDALEAAIAADPENAARLFQHGQVVVESSIQMPGNPNTIVYDTPSIQFIQAVGLSPDSEVDTAAYNKFISTAEKVSDREDQSVQMGLVPYLKLQSSISADDDFASSLKGMLDSLLSNLGVSKKDTIGDMAVNLVRRYIDDLDSVPDKLKDKAAQRLGSGVKSVLSKREYVAASSLDAWREFQALEKRRPDIVAEALIPLEKIIQMMGAYAFRNLEFAIASNKLEGGEDLRGFVRQVKSALQQDRILADPKTLEKIRIALARIGDQESYFEKAVEGIVFQWKGKMRKLTGLFTPINRLRGFFAYGASPAVIKDTQEESLRRNVWEWMEESKRGR